MWGPNGTLLPDQTRDCEPQPAYLANLPTDTDALLDYVRGRAGSDPSDQLVFSKIAELLQTSYLPPEVRAALISAVATIPGVSVGDTATDAAGRTGITVVHSDGGVRQELLFAPDTYEFLGAQLDAGPNGPDSVSLHPSAVLRIDIVDQPRQLP